MSVLNVDWSLASDAGDTFDDHVAAELAGEDDERAVREAAGFEIENELGDRAVDFLVQRSTVS